MKRIIYYFLSMAVLVMCIVFFHQDVSAKEILNNVIVFKGDYWQVTMSNYDNYLGTVKGNKKGNKYEKEYATATISGRTLKIKGTKSGGINYFYVYKKNGTLARKIHITVKEIPFVAAIGNSNQSKGNVHSTNVYLYEGQSATINATVTGSRDSFKWSCDKAGVTVGSPSALNTSIKGVKAGTYKITGTSSCTSSGSRKTVTNTRSINIYVYSSPQIQVYCNGTETTVIKMAKGSEVDISQKTNNVASVVNCVLSANVNSNSTDFIQLKKDERTGFYKLTTKEAFQENNNAYFTYSLKILSGDNVSNNNGTQIVSRVITVKLNDYYQITKVFFNNREVKLTVGSIFKQNPILEPVNKKTDCRLKWKSSNREIAAVSDDGEVSCKRPGKVYITAMTMDGGQIWDSYQLIVRLQSLNFRKIKDKKEGILLKWKPMNIATNYIIYRSTNKSGGYKRIFATKSCEYLDKKVSYGKKYYYKLQVVPKAGLNYASVYSKYMGMRHQVQKPKISKIRKINARCIYIKISGIQYDGYVIYMGKSKKTKKAVNIIGGNKCSLGIIPGRKNYIRVRAYKLVNKKRIYSKYSKAVKYK